MRKNLGWVAVMLLSCVCVNGAAAAEMPLLMQQPAMSKSEIVFVYGGYLWSVPREGGDGS